jgi:uncharacterized protein (DUF2062 family)
MMGFFKKFFYRLLHHESNPLKLAHAFCLGIFLAFSPYLGIQTLLAFLLSWVFKLNSKIVILVLYVVNNPWTMIPIMVLDYMVGQWIMNLIGIDLMPYNPSWMNWMNQKITAYLGKYLGVTELSLWNFIIGGNVIALLVSFSIYPFIKRAFIRFQLTANAHENYHSK